MASHRAHPRKPEPTLRNGHRSSSSAAPSPAASAGRPRPPHPDRVLSAGSARTGLPLAIRLPFPHICAMAPRKKPGFSETPQAAWNAEVSGKKERHLKTARGTSMGAKGTARERAAVGLMPMAGVDMTLEEAEAYLATLKPEPTKAPARGRGPAGA